MARSVSMGQTLLLGLLLCAQFSIGHGQETQDLESLVRDTQEESSHLANEIDNWTVAQRARLLSRDESRDLTRTRRSEGTNWLTVEKRGAHMKRKTRKKKQDSKTADSALSKAMQEFMSDDQQQQKLQQVLKNVKKRLKQLKKNDKNPVEEKTHTRKHKDTKKALGPSRQQQAEKKSKDGKHKHSVSAKLHGKTAKPLKKLYIMKGVQTVTIDHKTLKIMKKIPKSALNKLLKKSKLDKYLKLASFLSLGGKDETDGGTSLEKTMKGLVDHVKRADVDKNGIVKTPKKLVKVIKLLKKHKLPPEKQQPRRRKKNDHRKKKKNKRKGDKKNRKKKSKVYVHGSKKSEVEKTEKKAKKKQSMRKKTFKKRKIKNKATSAKTKSGKRKSKGKSSIKVRKAVKAAKKKVNRNRALKRKVISKPANKSKKKRIIKSKKGRKGAKELSHLKEKVKRANSLKFKVAKALLAHCETQNKLKKIFETVNASLKNAAKLAKAIGHKYGIKSNDVAKITSHHTEGAVEEFLNSIF